MRSLNWPNLLGDGFPSPTLMFATYWDSNLQLTALKINSLDNFIVFLTELDIWIKLNRRDYEWWEINFKHSSNFTPIIIQSGDGTQLAIDYDSSSPHLQEIGLSIYDDVVKFVTENWTQEWNLTWRGYDGYGQHDISILKTGLGELE